MSQIKYTIITAAKPAVISKSFTLEDGILCRRSGGALVEGFATKKEETIHEFLSSLKSLGSDSALCFGQPKTVGEKAKIVVKDRVAATKDECPVIARTEGDFEWPDGPGMFLGDVDVEIPQDELRALMYSVCPALQNVPHIMTASASTYIYSTADGAELNGPGGQRLYIPVTSARQIPLIGETLSQLLWLQGYGRIEISQAGTCLKRTVLDTSVWQPSRFDFAGGAWCGTGLEQRRPEPVIFNENGPFLDLDMLPAITPEEMAQIRKLQGDAIKSAQPAAEKQRQVWLEDRMADWERKQTTLGAPVTDEARGQTRDTLNRAAKSYRLLGDFELVSEDHGIVTVGEVLDNPEKYHGKTFGDPLEPDYNCNLGVAKAFLQDRKRPVIRSFAHGGRTFTLHRALKNVQISVGNMSTIIDEIIEQLRQEGDVYNRGGVMSYIGDGEILPMEPATLLYLLGSLLRFEKYSQKLKEWAPADCPVQYARCITRLRAKWELPELKGLLRAPTITPAGIVIEKEGFDAPTGLYLDFPEAANWRSVPYAPTDEEVKWAVRRLWQPFEEFPFIEDADRGSYLAGLFTAATRPTYPTAPGLIISATAPGTGKSYLSFCIQLMAGGRIEAMAPVYDDEAEMRKRLTTVAMSGVTTILIDNIDRPFESGALCSFLTSETWSDRILGSNAKGHFPNNLFLLLTGNNVTIKGDLSRRLLWSRLDAEMEHPEEREFSFNPVTYVREHLLDLRQAALTVLRAACIRSDKAKRSALGSFEAWNAFVRDAVIWVGEQGWLDVADPVLTMTQSSDENPERLQQSAFLRAWYNEFQDSERTVRQLVQYIERNLTDDDPFVEAVQSIEDIRGEITVKSLGYWIRSSKLKGRIIDGLVLRGKPGTYGQKYWVEPKKGRGRNDKEFTSAKPEGKKRQPALVCSIK
jgi:hypothetical protein